VRTGRLIAAIALVAVAIGGSAPAAAEPPDPDAPGPPRAEPPPDEPGDEPGEEPGVDLDPAPAPTPAPAPPAPAQPTREELAANRAACEHAEPDCDPVGMLSRLERRAVERALAGAGLVLAGPPHGRRIRRVHVVSLDVFGPGDGFLRWFNVLHVTTQERAVRAELTFAPGQPWDQRRIDESTRRLRDPTSTSLVAAVPVVAAGGGPDEVDVLVVVRDVWSLRTSTSYELQGTQLTYLSVSLSENNLFGLRKLLALNLQMDQGTYKVGPLYIDRNVLGRHVELRGRVGPIFNRYSRQLEGSDSVVVLSRPLWSLDTRWGAGLEWSHRVAIDRSYRGTGIRTYDAPETPEDDQLRHEYGMRRFATAASLIRAYGDRFEHRVRGGHQLQVQRPSLLDGFPDDPVLAAAFTRDVLPRSERTSVLYAGWDLAERRYRNYQNVRSFELAEEVRTGIELAASVGVAHRGWGSEAAFVRLSGVAGYGAAWAGDGLWKIRAAATTRIERGQAIDNVTDVTLRLVTPPVAVARLVSQLRFSGVFRDRQNQFYALGGDNGLRGYPVGELSGDRRVVWNTELRSAPLPILFSRWGVVLFHDVGAAADRLHALRLHNDVGLGLRMLVPQAAPEVYRFDLALALDGEHAGLLRFTAGYEQTF
jgi:hypothetical protein